MVHVVSDPAVPVHEPVTEFVAVGVGRGRVVAVLVGLGVGVDVAVAAGFGPPSPRSNSAFSVTSPSMVIVHVSFVPKVSHAPVQPPNLDPGAGTAVIVTRDPFAYGPAGETVTSPWPLPPPIVNLTVNVAAAVAVGVATGTIGLVVVSQESQAAKGRANANNRKSGSFIAPSRAQKAGQYAPLCAGVKKNFRAAQQSAFILIFAFNSPILPSC
jgi:hypothetical protein